METPASSTGAPSPAYRALFAIGLLVLGGSLVLGLSGSLRIWGTPPSIVFDPILLGKKHQVEGDLEAAAREFRIAGRVGRGTVDSRELLVAVYRQQGDRDAILQLYRERISDQPLDPSAHFELGGVLLESGHLQEGIETLERLHRFAPAYPQLDEALGRAYLMAGRPGEAESAFRNGLGRNRLSASLHEGLGQALERQGRLEEARQEYDLALKLAPNSEAAASGLRRVQTRSPFQP